MPGDDVGENGHHVVFEVLMLAQLALADDGVVRSVARRVVVVALILTKAPGASKRSRRG